MSKEKWVEIEGHPKYLINNYGEVFSVKTQKALKWNTATGYPRVNLDGKYYTVHQLVAFNFIGPRPDGMLVCHKDDNTMNNYVGNLYYGTPKDNTHDKLVNGKGRKLTDDEVREIKRRLLNGEQGKKIAPDYGVTDRTISKINTGERYSWIPIEARRVSENA